MDPQKISRWIRAGLWVLAVAWLVTAFSTLEPQPDQTKALRSADTVKKHLG